MRTVGPRPQSWSSLAANVYSHLDNERSEAASRGHKREGGIRNARRTGRRRSRVRTEAELGGA